MAVLLMPDFGDSFSAVTSLVPAEHACNIARQASRWLCSLLVSCQPRFKKSTVSAHKSLSGVNVKCEGGTCYQWIPECVSIVLASSCACCSSNDLAAPCMRARSSSAAAATRSDQHHKYMWHVTIIVHPHAYAFDDSACVVCSWI